MEKGYSRREMRFLSVRIDDELARDLDRVATLVRERYAHSHVSTSAVARRSLAIGLRRMEREMVEQIAENGRKKKR